MENHPLDENRLYYSITEVAEILKVSISNVRYWEKQFDMIKPYRNKRGKRFFTVEDMRNLELVKYLVKERGMTIKGVKRKLEENKDDTYNNFLIVTRLKKIREILIKVKEEL